MGGLVPGPMWSTMVVPLPGVGFVRQGPLANIPPSARRPAIGFRVVAAGAPRNRRVVAPRGEAATRGIWLSMGGMLVSP